MKMRFFIAGLCSLCMLCTACDQNYVAGKNAIVNEKQEGEGMQTMENLTSVTEEQKNLLAKISVNEERVKEGELLQWQKEVLKQYDYAMDYLSRKYPSYTFHIVDCEPKNVFNAYTTFNFTEESDSEGYYDLYLESEDGKYQAKDNFYGHLIQAEYESRLMSLLQEAQIPCSRVEASIHSVQGEAFNEKMDIDEVINGHISMQQSVDFYIDSSSLQESEYKETAAKLRQLIEDHHIYGSFFITIFDADSSQALYEDSFNTFD